MSSDNGEEMEAAMFEEIMQDVHRQWLEEFDHEAAIRRQLPRRDHESRARRLLSFRGRRSGGGVAERYPQAQQCT